MTIKMGPIHTPAERRLQPEMMDRPDLDERLHVEALRGLARLNTWSRSARILWPPIRGLARELPRPVRILDVSAGGGDVPIGLMRIARRERIELEIDGCDISPRAVAFASRKAAAEGCRIGFSVRDVLAGPLPPGYDVVMCSLFLHHLTEVRAAGLLKTMSEAAGRLLLVNDLRRCAGGAILAWTATRLLTLSRVVRYDAMRSVEGAFNMDEARALARTAGLEGARVSPRWPFRFLLSWTKP